MSPGPTAAQGEADQQLGNVHFKTSCNDVAQRRFDRAMRYQHSYWYLNAKEVFEEALKADPTCAMAQWGVALTLMDNPHNSIPRPNLAPGLAAIEKAKAMNAKTERERDYIDALMVMYADHDKLSHIQRMRLLATRRPRSRRNILMMTRRRSPMPSRSTHRPTSTTRPTPSRAKARRYWSQSPSGYRSIQASRII